MQEHTAIPGEALPPIPEECYPPGAVVLPPVRPHVCPHCETETTYQSFSGGREWYCPGCEADGSYDVGEAPRRVQMIAAGKFAELRSELGL